MYIPWYMPWYIPWYIPWHVPWHIPWYIIHHGIWHGIYHGIYHGVYHCIYHSCCSEQQDLLFWTARTLVLNSKLTCSEQEFLLSRTTRSLVVQNNTNCCCSEQQRFLLFWTTWSLVVLNNKNLVVQNNNNHCCSEQGCYCSDHPKPGQMLWFITFSMVCPGQNHLNRLKRARVISCWFCCDLLCRTSVYYGNCRPFISIHIHVCVIKKTHQQRKNRLRQFGFTEKEIDRVHGPIGLDIGASSPEEIAISILSEVIATLRVVKWYYAFLI